MKIILINGFPESGKDTFVDFCLKILGPYGTKISTIDFIKDLATQLGWDGTKDARNRKFLSDLKDLLAEWNDIPVKKIKNAIKYFEAKLSEYEVEEHGVVFIFSREPVELLRLRKELNAITLLIIKDKKDETNYSNHSDKEVMNFNYDYIITNNSSLEKLQSKAKSFVYNILEWRK